MIKDQENVIVLDFGGQYSQLIARRVREASIYCEILPYNTPMDEILKRKPKAIVFSGGPASVYSENAPVCDKRIFDTGIPILGICYGMQLMCHMLGGRVEPAETAEYGRAELVVEEEDGIFSGLEKNLTVWMSHGDSIITLPEGFRTLARTKNTPHAAIGNGRNLFGVQFHPEVVHTPRGREILNNFLFGIAGCTGTWSMKTFVEEQIRLIRERVGNGRALCALSGGVDSSVAAVITHRALGDNLTCIFVDHGLLRKDEARKVIETFKDKFHINLIAVDASDRFLKRLEGVTDPEAKRRIIGEEFIRVFEDEAKKLGKIDFLVQGTLYPDVIESGTQTAAVIKTHHNVGGLPQDLNFELIEPLRDLFKDEVRKVGLQLGLPEEIVYRQPFPGPGLAVRVLGEVTREKLSILREADAIVTEEVKKAGLDRELWQAFAVLTDVKSVGVMGDERTYAYTVAIRAVTSEDGMTADWARLPYDLLDNMSTRIVNEVPGVNRVVYDITSKPPATIEWE
ncbi:glutamine-hydrolyzing GMP synthase [Thermosediminibacter oceani]|uniref:GMP synthase [glutamine-hydrolyzing] n=1 Tax=Thermosediminibacter oceani (strain ATCC BAA-1034 / DSM 16646 / JW/IW-1228P) TaxID=555079 RepID=D9S0X0_THEOJ|nr:glutamine-hydrolyzing GMP synthase [Thermosediminibacter oceani]ADL07134.1 GMP synthase (glutamine-hydrolyzing) [Thermosediminibacter oceani DSM 16646]